MPNLHQEVKAIYRSLPAISAYSLCFLSSIVFGSMYLHVRANRSFPHGRTSCYFTSVTIKPKDLEITYLVQLLDLCSMHDHDITVLQEDFENFFLFLPLVIGLSFATNIDRGFWSPLHNRTTTNGDGRNGWAQGLFAIIVVLQL
jgi:hypothetical protein